MAEASSPTSFDPRLARVVKIKIADGSLEATVGSGYLVAPGLVLTARHVLWRDDKGANGGYPLGDLRVWAGTGQSAGASLLVSQAIVLGEVSGVDVAVLVVPGLEPVAGTAVVGARFTTSQPVPGCWMIGYPKAAHQDGTVDAEYVGVSIIPVSGNASGRIAVQVTTPPAREDADWQGLSGAGVVDAQERLVGVLASVQVRWDERLGVVPVQALVNAAGERCDEHPELRPVADLVVANESSEVVAERARISLFDRSKFPPRMTDLSRESLFNALQYKNRTVPFINDGTSGRLVEETLAWIRVTGDHPDLKVAVVTGPGGVGKSRLAAEICDQLAHSDPWWRTGFADQKKLLAALIPTVPTVVVCDYPERHPEAVGTFLTRIHGHRNAGLLQAPIRVLLVSRDEQSWTERMRERCTNLDILIDHRITLTLKQFGIVKQILHAAVSYTAFSEGFGIPQEVRPDFAIGGRSELNRPLLVHAAALLASSQRTQPNSEEASASAGPLVTNQGRLLDDLINAEIRRLQRLRYDDDTAEGAVVFTSANAVREAMCVITLTTPKRMHLPDLLACTEAFGPRGNLNSIPAADTLLSCYPAGDATTGADPADQCLSAVEPDLIAAHLLYGTPGRSALVKRLIASDVVAEQPEYRAQLISALALAAKDYPDIETDLKEHLAGSLADLIDAGQTGHASLAELLADHLPSLLNVTIAAADEQNLAAARQLTTALQLPAPGSEHWIDEASAYAHKLMPFPHSALTGLGVALATRALAHHERNDELAQVAWTSLSLGAWLGTNGQRGEARVHTQRAVELYEALTTENHSMYSPALAASVHNFAAYGTDLELSQHAVDLYEELIVQNRPANLHGLATSVTNLAGKLAEAGRRDEALECAQRAVDLHEELAAKNRAAFLPALATSVHNLAPRLAETGHQDEALRCIQRAVGLREELVAKNRVAFLPALAASVHNLAHQLSKAGRDETLTQLQRACDLYEELVAIDRAIYLPKFAESMKHYAIMLVEAGRGERIPQTQRSVDLYEELVTEGRTDYFSDLTASVYALCHHFREAGLRDEALAQVQRVIDLRDELNIQDRPYYLQGLAAIVYSVARELADEGEYEAALTPTQRAVDLYEELVTENPGDILHDLTGGLNQLSILYAIAGRDDEAIECAFRHVALCEELVAVDHAGYLPHLAFGVESLALRLAEAGRVEAIEHVQRNVNLCEELVANDRATYLPHLATSYSTAAGLRHLLNVDIAAGLEWCGRAISLFQELKTTEPDMYDSELESVMFLQVEFTSMLDDQDPVD